MAEHPANPHGVLGAALGTVDSDPTQPWVTVIKGAKRWKRSSKAQANQSPIITGPLYYACAGPDAKIVSFKSDSELDETFLEETEYKWDVSDACRKPRSRRSKPARYVSDESLQSMRNHNVFAQAAAIQRAIDLANGKGITHVLDFTTKEWVRVPMYTGTEVIANENRKRPAVWSRRRCRIYDDPYGGSIPGTNPAYF